MNTKEPQPITYHVEFYAAKENASRAAFDTLLLLSQYRVEKSEADYVVFSTDESRTDVIRECEKMLKDNFYYVLAFERDGGVFVKTHPDTARRRLLALEGEEKSDIMIVLDALADTLSMKAKVHLQLKK